MSPLCRLNAIPLHRFTPVGASLLAKNVNDDARILNARGALRLFASKLAPTKKENNNKESTV
ncbi:hypothetical protein EKA85_29860 [Pseudomonas veronii]|nr:hypothetical protein EKA85_29860 [Pseudomonas veronii]